MKTKRIIFFSPKEDITVYELAECLKWYSFALDGRWEVTDKEKRVFDFYGDNVKRHFRITK